MADITATLSHKYDDWTTPDDLWQALHEEFRFDLDAAATYQNKKVVTYLGPRSMWGEDALLADWNIFQETTAFCNPPYSLAAKFIAKAERERDERHVRSVLLLPARTDTRAFHGHIWNVATNRPYNGVEVRFLKGRLKFGGPTKSGKPEPAPFPSMVVIWSD